MNSIKMAFFFSSLAALLGCGSTKDSAPAWQKPQMSTEEIAKGEFTPQIMLKMGRISEPQLSPDGSQILYGITYYNVEENSSRTNLYIQSTETGAEPKMVTTGDFKDTNQRWSSDGKGIYFLSNRSKESQLWKMDIESESMKQLSSVENGIGGFEVSNGGDKIWFTMQIKVDQTAKDIYPNLQKAKAMIYDDLMVRHWNYWLDGTYSHLIVADLTGDGIANQKDIMQDEPWDAPLAPYFDISEIKWNNAGTQIAYTSKKLKGKEYAYSTNSEIYLYDITTGTTKNLTEGMVGYDRTPLFSPDDKQIAWLSMERAGNESDKSRLFVMDLTTGGKSYVTKSFDYNAANLVWSNNNEIYFIAPMQATHQICKVEAKENAEVKVLTEGLHDYISLSLAQGKMIAEKTTLSRAPEVFSIDPTNGKENQLTFINKDIYNNVKMGEVQKRMIKTTDGKEMLTWVLLPADFDSTKTYPALLYCEGGPQSVVSQRWSYRWNLQLMASQGYVVVAPNRRGLPSFGQEWLDQISGDYSGQNIKDYLSAIDNVSSEKWVNKDRLGCVGASYGGYSVYYLAGNHNKRFKTFISHCGMFNFESFYTSTEELWFPTNDLGGAPWSDNPTAKRSYANSPHKFANNWDTPIMIMVGLLDYRIPYTESLQAFTTAQAKGIEARLVTFEDEGHQVFKPQNSLVWHYEFFGWLDKYLKK